MMDQAAFRDELRRPTSLKTSAEGKPRVHVWRVPLRVDLDEEMRLREVLAPLELELADRIHSERDRRAFTTVRGVLRILLGRYLNRRPSSLHFTRGLFGKPALCEHDNPLGITFNVAHSWESALVAFAIAVDIGVDVEYVESERSVVALAELIFSARERAQFFSLPLLDRKAAFYRAWTRKEAVVKALGCGLSMPLSSFEVTFTLEESPAILWTAPESAGISVYSLYGIDVDGAYAAALALAARDIDLCVWDWVGEY